jgi:hypothetical protein
VRLAQREEVDLILTDGRRPLLGSGVPRGDMGTVLSKAVPDVAVLVARDDATVELTDEAPVVVPFGGAQHDWAALELGAWIASASDASLRLIGAAAQAGEGKDVSGLLGSAALLVRQLRSVRTETIVAQPGRQGILEAAAGAGLLIIGLSDRWRREGLGTARAAIANAGVAPIVFVRRGLRPGVLAPSEDVTRFTWSSPALIDGGQH